MKNTAVANSGNPLLRPALLGSGLMAITLLVGGCEIRPKPFVHMVEYQSQAACAATPGDCSWEHLKREAELSALVNCVLAGANVLEILEDGASAGSTLRRVVTPLPPRYGYERRHVADQVNTCATEQTPCSIASRHDRAFTWATCGTRPLAETELRGGEDLDHADGLTQTDVVTGTLAQAVDDYSLPAGLDGPDHLYQFTVTERTRIEAAVAANRATWSGVVGLVQSAWQPALHLLSSSGAQIQRGYVLRAGVTALFPTELDPGTYYLVVDSATQEWKRGDGIYRLYLGFNQHNLGPPVESVSLQY